MSNIKLSCLLAVVMLFSFAKEGHVSQVSLRNITLEDLVKKSDAILVVSKMNPDITVEKVPIDETRKYPPYERHRFHLNILETLLNKSTRKDLEGPIGILGANDEDQYQLIKKYHLEQILESPVYSSYNSAVLYKNVSEPFIVFLITRPDGEFEFAVQGAFESIKKKNAVLNLIAKLSEQKRPHLKQ